jgi:hypothetical protein
MAIRVLADENIKLSILTTKPVNVEAPTAAELNAGIDASCLVDYNSFQWAAAASTAVNERLLCEGTESSRPGAGNYNLSVTPFRWFDDTTGGFDATGDLLFEALKVKGTEVYGYVRRMDKKYSTPWAAGDEIQLGGSMLTDTPTPPDNAGSIKYLVPLSAVQMVDFGEVAAGV